MGGHHQKPTLSTLSTHLIRGNLSLRGIIMDKHKRWVPVGLGLGLAAVLLPCGAAQCNTHSNSPSSLVAASTTIEATATLPTRFDVSKDEQGTRKRLVRVGPVVVADLTSGETHDLDLRAVAVVPADGSPPSVSLTVTSSYADGEVHTIPVEVAVNKAPLRVVQPRLALGVSAFAGASLPAPTQPVAGAGASLMLPWLYPRPDISVLTPRVTLGAVRHTLSQDTRFSFRGGVDVVSGNLGRKNGFIQDLWLGVGPSYGTDGSWSVDLTLSTRL